MSLRLLLLASSAIFAAMPGYTQSPGQAVPSTATTTENAASANPQDPSQDVVGPVMAPEEKLPPTLMFSETDIKNLAKVVVALKATVSPQQVLDKTSLSEDDILKEILRRSGEEGEELSAMPEFYLSSMIYRSPDSWMIWLRVNEIAPPVIAQPEQEDASTQQLQQTVDSLLGGSQKTDTAAAAQKPLVKNERIVLTAQHPENAERGLRVEKINSREVTLAYKPASISTAALRYEARENETARAKRFDSRINIGKDIVFDKTLNEFILTLQPNQTISLDMMRYVEGRTFTPTFKSTSPTTPLPTGMTADEAAALPLDEEPVFTGPMNEREISDELINNIKALQKFVPVAVPQPQ